MLVFYLPLLLLGLPTLGQFGFTFWRLRSHDREYVWKVCGWAMAGQVLASLVAPFIALYGYAQRDIHCVIGVPLLFIGGLVMTVTVVPIIAQLAAKLSKESLRPAEPPRPRVGL